MEWISIEDHRPEISTLVLTLCSKGSNWLAFRANGGWYINTNYGQIYVTNDDPAKQIEIVYWTTIPEIPKKHFNELFLVRKIDDKIDSLERQKEYAENEDDCTAYSIRILELQNIRDLVISVNT